ncbi:uncharacterized protein LOC142521865 [Primulina tabacum]|uniref:uncharacterized protein LOC142521865 n=1 Tax=Primulina tabacum TaxID=48773 RepID=UPI003F59F95D
MAGEGKTIGKPHFQHQDKANTQSRIMITNHAARSSKRVDLARELGSMTASGKEFQNIQGMLNNQMDGVSKHQHNDLQGMTRKSKFFGKSHFQLRDEEDTQECQNIQGMTLKNKNVGKTHFPLQDETNTQPLILIDNHITRNSKERFYHTRELENVVTSGKDCQSIQGASRNQIDEASNQKDIELQGFFGDRRVIADAFKYVAYDAVMVFGLSVCPDRYMITLEVVGCILLSKCRVCGCVAFYGVRRRLGCLYGFELIP